MVVTVFTNGKRILELHYRWSQVAVVVNAYKIVYHIPLLSYLPEVVFEFGIMKITLVVIPVQLLVHSHHLEFRTPHFLLTPLWTLWRTMAKYAIILLTFTSSYFVVRITLFLY